jgi:hypothetical protein
MLNIRLTKKEDAEERRMQRSLANSKQVNE